jgi:hypothetical protein
MSTTLQKTVTFIQYDIPPLKSGEYKLVAHQTVDQTAPNDFTAQRTFAVGGNRFSLAGDDIVSYFPPANANGEFDGVLPNVVLKRSTLPWQRTSVADELDAPWLAVLLLEQGDAPKVQTGTAADVIPIGATITVIGSPTTTGTGAMPAGTLSYPGINPLDYGQSPDTPTNYIDLPVALFSQIAPSALDLPYLAHIREIDTLDSADDTQLSKQFSVVLGNRIPVSTGSEVALLVSLENMGDYLPDDAGNASTLLPSGTTTIRLIVLASWNFYTNDLDESFKNLAENLNKDAAGQLGATTVKIDAPAPDATAVAGAITSEATALTGANADALVLNALAQGYVPLDHHLREAGDTVSWYRGPLLPYGAAGSFINIPAFGPDALLRYDPYLGMFDTSYAGAWQLGQLLALQSSAYSTALYQWKKTLAKGVAAQEEQALLAAKLGDGAVFPSLVKLRDTRCLGLPAIPDIVAQFIAQLRLLVGVPFDWLVPSEAMLPTESFRLFSMDPNWIGALVDGAFSIGRATQGELQVDAQQQSSLMSVSAAAARLRRVNDRPSLKLIKDTRLDAPLDGVTGVLLRSQLVSGWPRLNINGYADAAGATEVPKLRMTPLSRDVILCLFDGPVSMIAIHEAPEQLHCGVELANGAASTTLRAVTGPNPGEQFLTDPKGGPASATVALRSDNRTLKVADSAQSVMAKLNSDFSQNISNFTSAEFALEFIKGVVKVEFVVGD